MMQNIVNITGNVIFSPNHNATHCISDGFFSMSKRISFVLSLYLLMIHRNAQVRRFTTKKVVCCARERGTREPERENRETVAQNGQTKRQILKYLVSFR